MRDMKIFHGLQNKTLDFLEESSNVKTYKKGEIVCTEGEPANELFFIEDGSVVIESEGQKLAVLQEGEGFGEMSVLDMMRRATDVIANEDLKVRILKRSEIYKLYKKDIKEYVIIITNLARELSRRLRKTDKLMVQTLNGNENQEGLIKL
ncbi:MAG: Crp/Fnr family transcriptional regulator [Fusobacteriota bacterium]